MGKYTSDDNRSMQLNDNNDRYWSSRDIDPHDGCEDDEIRDNHAKEDCGACAHCIQYYSTGSWLPCLFPKEARPTRPHMMFTRMEQHGRREYNRMEYLYSVWNNAENVGMPYESYKDAKNEYRRLKRWLNKNTHDLHEQLYWEQ
tara:strand:- start:12 stop:443 length:432 start_codon:yes stop_codon:yes gene_type:complete